MIAKVTQESLDKLIEQNSFYLLKIQELEKLNSTYVEILEKTNSQLSLWFNPYGLMVGALSVVVALVAIVAGVYLFLQNSENKKMLKEELKKQMEEIKIDATLAINNLIEENEKTVKDSIGMSKIQAEKVLSDLKSKKKLFESEIQINSLVGKYMKEEDYICRNCRMFSIGGGGSGGIYEGLYNPFKTWNGSVNEGGPLSGNIYTNRNKIHCIKCGNLMD